MKTLFNSKKIASYLPVFNGFYNTVFEADENSVIESPYNYENYTFFYQEYREEMAMACVKQIEKRLSGIEGFDFGIKIDFDCVSSPREYNFVNDSIWVNYTLSEQTAKEIFRYLIEHSKEFGKYIKERYTSRDGFMSWYSNDSMEWLTEYLNDKKKLEHCFGTILDFILSDYTPFNLYEDVVYSVGVYLNGQLNEDVEFVENTINEYTNAHYMSKNQTEITTHLVNHFDVLGVCHEYLDFKYIAKRVNNVFYNIEKNTLSLFGKN